VQKLWERRKALERCRVATHSRRREQQTHGSPALAGTVGDGADRLDQTLKETGEGLSTACEARERREYESYTPSQNN